MSANGDSKNDAMHMRISSWIINEITEYRLKPGDKIVQEDIAKHFGCSHTPVRAAVQSLVDKGWLSQSSGKSAVVGKPALDDFVSLYTLRSEIAKYSAIQSAERMTEDQLAHLESAARDADNAALNRDMRERVRTDLKFHQQLVICSGNPYFVQISEKVDSRRKFYMSCMADAFFCPCDSVDQLPSTHALLLNNIRLARLTGNVQPLELAIGHHFSLYPFLNWDKASTNYYRAENSFSDPLLRKKKEGDSISAHTVSINDFNQMREKNPFLQVNKVVCDQLLRAIMTGTLKYDDVIRINDIVAELNISRTPVVEAVKALVNEGYLSDSGSRGTYVCRLSDVEIENIFYARMSLETAAAGLAAKNATNSEVKNILRYVEDLKTAIEKESVEDCIIYDSAFHSEIINASHSPYIIRAYQTIYPRIRIWVWQAARVKEYKKDTWKSVCYEHDSVARAVKMANYDEAKTSMRSHLLGLMAKGGKDSRLFFSGYNF